MTTFDKFFMENPAQKEIYQKEYNDFLLSEFIIGFGCNPAATDLYGTLSRMAAAVLCFHVSVTLKARLQFFFTFPCLGCQSFKHMIYLQQSRTCPGKKEKNTYPFRYNHEPLSKEPQK